MPSIHIGYARKDILLKNFLEAKSEIPISNMIELAVEYFAKTGNYMSLTVVSVTDEHPDKHSKTLYFSNNSLAYQYITESQKNGKSPLKLIREIIEHGVDIGEVTEVITQKDYIFRLKELRDQQSHNTQTVQKVLRKENEKKETIHSFQTEKTQGAVQTMAKDEAMTSTTGSATSAKTTNNSGKAAKKRLTLADDFIHSF